MPTLIEIDETIAEHAQAVPGALGHLAAETAGEALVEFALPMLCVAALLAMVAAILLVPFSAFGELSNNHPRSLFSYDSPSPDSEANAHLEE